MKHSLPLHPDVETRLPVHVQPPFESTSTDNQTNPTAAGTLEICDQGEPIEPQISSLPRLADADPAIALCAAHPPLGRRRKPGPGRFAE